MGKRVLIISTSLRSGSNSDILAGGGVADANRASEHDEIMKKAFDLGKAV